MTRSPLPSRRYRNGWFLGRPSAAPAATQAASATREGPQSDRLPVISATKTAELKELVDREVRVGGRVRSTNASRSGHQFLDFYSSDLRVICLREDVGKFHARPWKSLVEQDLVIRGQLELHQGRLQVRLRHPEQVQPADTARQDAAEPVPRDPPLERTTGPSRVGGQTPSRSTDTVLREVGRNQWVSASGLSFRGTDPNGLSRRDHILRHAQDDPTREGSHGVFDAQGDDVFLLIDEAWRKA